MDDFPRSRDVMNDGFLMANFLKNHGDMDPGWFLEDS
jgi:hypothetical protein